MAKRINITDKLDLDSKPEIEIRGEVFTVNDEAETILKIIELGEKDSAKSLREVGAHAGEAIRALTMSVNPP